MQSGYAAYYYVEGNEPIYIGKSKIYIADRWKSKGVKCSGKSYLVSIRDIFNDIEKKPLKKWEKNLGNSKISITNDSTEQILAFDNCFCSLYWSSV